MKPKILIVDDEQNIRRQVKIGLAAHGYDIITAANGAEALTLAAQHSPDLIILDISLGAPPDGLTVCQRLREWTSTPIIMLSVHNEEKTIVAALTAGADDYLTKPFGMDELNARIIAVRRRALAQPTSPIRTAISAGDLHIDLVNRTVTVQGQPVHLTPTEYELLRLLATHPGKVMTHRYILSAIWGPDYADMDHYVRVFVNQLRKKLHEDPARNIRYILNEPGVGYRFITLD